MLHGQPLSSAPENDALDGLDPRRRPGAADRDRMLRAGITAVLISCGVFAVTRAFAQWQTGLLTPWWANAVGFVVLSGFALYYLRDPAARGTLTVHATGVVTLVALVIPVFYGMTSSIWWLSLLGFGMVMLARPREGAVWALIVVGAVLGVSAAESFYQLPGALGESHLEIVLARAFFVIIVMGLAHVFRSAAEHRAQELTEAAEELARANASKQRFLALMSHELRTPLHGVIAMTDLALMEPLEIEARAHVSTAHTSARLLLRMLNDVLDASWETPDALSLEIGSFRLHSMVGDVLRPLARQASERGIRFRATADPDLPERRRGDATRVAQILLNLCSNALKFTHQGRISVHLSAAGPDRVAIVVEDSGRGVPEAMRQSVFEPFSQVETGDAKLGGVGLGLNIVQELATRMHGVVRCEEAVGDGARFVVELELVVEHPAPGVEELLTAPSAASLPPRLKTSAPIRILAAEDDPTNQVVLRALCSRLGHPVVLVADGLEALEALAADDYDVLLTDVQMPRMDGYTLVEHVRSLPGEAASIPIIVCSAQFGADEAIRLAELEIGLQLPKPFTLDALKGVLDQACAAP